MKPWKLALLLAIPCSNRMVTAGCLYAQESPTTEGKPTEEVWTGASPMAQLLLDHRAGLLEEGALPQRLRSMSPNHTKLFFETLRSGLYDVRNTTGKTSKRNLSDWEHRLLVESFDSVHLPELRRFLAEQSKDGVDTSLRHTVLELLGAHGNHLDVQSLIHWAVEFGSNQRLPRELRSDFHSSLSQLLRRDAEASAELLKAFDTLHLALVPEVVRAVGAIGSAQGAMTLARMLGRIPEADGLLLTELGHAGGSLHQPVPLEVRELVHAALLRAKDATLSAAILANGRLGSPEAVGDLIPLLLHKDKRIAKQAHEALGSITKQQFSNDPSIWLLWHQEELRWLREDYPSWIARAKTGTPTQSSHAMLEISKHRLFREQIAPEMLECLKRPEEELVLLNCAILGHLGSFCSVPALLQLLEPNQSIPVRKAAFDALCRMTGQNHGDSPDAWREAGW